jgi:hypothetical protein
MGKKSGSATLLDSVVSTESGLRIPIYFNRMRIWIGASIWDRIFIQIRIEYDGIPNPEWGFELMRIFICESNYFKGVLL